MSNNIPQALKAGAGEMVFANREIFDSLMALESPQQVLDFYHTVESNWDEISKFWSTSAVMDPKRIDGMTRRQVLVYRALFRAFLFPANPRKKSSPHDFTFGDVFTEYAEPHEVKQALFIIGVLKESL